MNIRQSIENVRRFLVGIFNKIRSNKAIGVLLTSLSFVYPVVLMVLSWDELRSIESINISFVLYALAIYALSALIQFLNWLVILNLGFSTFLLDLKIYFTTILMQRLPGGFWQWVGRVNLYNSTKSISSRQTLSASAYERIVLILTGFGSFLAFEWGWPGILALIVICLSLMIWRMRKSYQGWRVYVVPIFQILSYVFCWILGGMILLMIIRSVQPLADIALLESISIWSLTGSISLVFFFLPGGLGIREISLTALLMPALNFSQSILTALILRILYLGADILIGVMGLLIFRLFARRTSGEGVLKDSRPSEEEIEEEDTSHGMENDQ